MNNFPIKSKKSVKKRGGGGLEKVTWNSRNWPLTKRKTRLDFPAPISPRRTWWKNRVRGHYRNRKDGASNKGNHQFGIEIVVPDRSHGKRIGSIGSEERNENPKSEILELCTLRIRRIEDWNNQFEETQTLSLSLNSIASRIRWVSLLASASKRARFICFYCRFCLLLFIYFLPPLFFCFFCAFVVIGNGGLTLTGKCKIAFAYSMGKSRNEYVPTEGTPIFDPFPLCWWGPYAIHVFLLSHE